VKTLEIPLAVDATYQYIVEQLKDGNTLAKTLLKKVSFDKGRFFALLHPSADKTKIYNFRSGGILPQNPLEPVAFRGKIYPGRRKSDSCLQLAEYLKNALQPTWCCYFEDLLHRKQDPIAVQFKQNTLYYREEPYLFLQNTQFSTERAEKMIQFADAQWYYMNVVSEEEPGYSSDITEEKLQSIATKTVSLVLGAYDMEGFIIWEK